MRGDEGRPGPCTSLVALQSNLARFWAIDNAPVWKMWLCNENVTSHDSNYRPTTVELQANLVPRPSGCCSSPNAKRSSRRLFSYDCHAYVTSVTV